MTKGICMKCGFIDDYEFKNEKGSTITPICKRCQKPAVAYTSKIKRYFVCTTCKHTIKLPEPTAISVLVNKESLKCDRNECTGHLKETTQFAYLEYSGQLKRHVESEVKTLLDFSDKKQRKEGEWDSTR